MEEGIESGDQRGYWAYGRLRWVYNLLPIIDAEVGDLEPIIQSEVDEEEKNKYCILVHINEIQKDGTDEPTGRAGTEMQTWRTDLWTQRQKERVRQNE